MSDVFLVGLQLGFCIGNMIYFGDQLDELFCVNFELDFCDKKPFWSIVASFCLLPLCMFKELKDLSWFSLFANVVATASILILIGYESSIIPD